MGTTYSILITSYKVIIISVLKIKIYILIIIELVLELGSEGDVSVLGVSLRNIVTVPGSW